jgi:hypothetical protein
MINPTPSEAQEPSILMKPNAPRPASRRVTHLRLAQLPPRSCPRHTRPGPCPECQRLAVLRSAAHMAASVRAAEEWARHRVA